MCQQFKKKTTNYNLITTYSIVSLQFSVDSIKGSHPFLFLLKKYPRDLIIESDPPSGFSLTCTKLLVALSFTSLAYAKRKDEEVGLKNIEFYMQIYYS